MSMQILSGCLKMIFKRHSCFISIVVGIISASTLLARAEVLFEEPAEAQPTSSATVDLKPEDLRARLTNAFKKYETKHFVVFSDAPGSTVRTLTGTLERTHHQFERSCRRLQLQPKALTRKFSCVLFNDRQAFQKFARQWDNISAGWVGGYFANAGNYMAFYVAEDTPGMAEAEKQFAEWEVKQAEIQQQIRIARSAGKSARVRQLEEYAEQLAAHLKGERIRLNGFTDGEAQSRTIHETVHLLAFNTGVQIRERLAPFWLSEGLATNFESVSSNGAFGPDFENKRRQAGFAKILRDDDLVPLRILLGVTDATTVGNKRAEVLYQESYALFRWLYRFRRKELSAFFRLYAQNQNTKGALAGGVLTKSEHRAAFEQIFGSIEKLETRWLRWERGQLK